MGLLQIHNQIQKELDGGTSRIDLFRTLSEKTPSNTAKFAYCLASIPYPERRQKYLKLNAVLFLFLLLLPVFTIGAEWPIDFQQPTLFIAIKSSVPLMLAYFVFQFHGGVYRILGIWCIIDLIESALLLNFTTFAGLGKTVLLVIIIAMGLLIAKKAFPNLKTIGPKQDQQGRYLI